MKHLCDKCGEPTPDVLTRRIMRIYFGSGKLLGTIGLCMNCYGRLVNEFIRPLAAGPKEIAEHMAARYRGET
jgi:hypothetical protein